MTTQVYISRRNRDIYVSEKYVRKRYVSTPRESLKEKSHSQSEIKSDESSQEKVSERSKSESYIFSSSKEKSGGFFEIKESMIKKDEPSLVYKPLPSPKFTNRPKSPIPLTPKDIEARVNKGCDITKIISPDYLIKSLCGDYGGTSQDIFSRYGKNMLFLTLLRKKYIISYFNKEEWIGEVNFVTMDEIEDGDNWKDLSPLELDIAKGYYTALMLEFVDPESSVEIYKYTDNKFVQYRYEQWVCSSRVSSPPMSNLTTFSSTAGKLAIPSQNLTFPNTSYSYSYNLKPRQGILKISS